RGGNNRLELTDALAQRWMMGAFLSVSAEKFPSRRFASSTIHRGTWSGSPDAVSTTGSRPTTLLVHIGETTPGRSAVALVQRGNHRFPIESDVPVRTSGGDAGRNEEFHSARRQTFHIGLVYRVLPENAVDARREDHWNSEAQHFVEHPGRERVADTGRHFVQGVERQRRGEHRIGPRQRLHLTRSALLH